MFEYIQFYTKNLSNFTILLLIGVVIAILDITIRNVIRDVYLNVRENMRGKDREHEGMENKGDGAESGVCPKDCNAVEALRSKLTGLIENAAKLQNDIKQNNETIKQQQRLIEIMQMSVQKLVEKSK
jgi:flagellar biosynthesis/type III secretory pathway M-ring protein FliF/YscJ